MGGKGGKGGWGRGGGEYRMWVPLRTAWKSVTSAVAGLCAGARVTRGEAMAEVASSATAPRRVVSCILVFVRGCVGLSLTRTGTAVED